MYAYMTVCVCVQMVTCLSVCLSLCIHDAVCLYLDGDLVTLADSSLSEFLESLSKFTRYSALPSVL